MRDESLAEIGDEGYRSILPHGEQRGVSAVDGRKQNEGDDETGEDATHSVRLNEHGFAVRGRDQDPEEVERHLVNVICGVEEPTPEDGARLVGGLAALSGASGALRQKNAVVSIDEDGQSSEPIGAPMYEGAEHEDRFRSFIVRSEIFEVDRLAATVEHEVQAGEHAAAGFVAPGRFDVTLRSLALSPGSDPAAVADHVLRNTIAAAKLWGARVALDSKAKVALSEAGAEWRRAISSVVPAKRAAPRPVAPSPSDPMTETTERAHEVRLCVRELRADPSRRIVKGEVYVPFDPNEGADYPLDLINDRVDTWGTFIRSGTLERLAHDYLQFYRNVDQMHDRTTRAGDPVESYISDGSDGYAKGAWVMAVRVAESLWPKVEERKLTGFSIDVQARRRPTAIRVKGFGSTVDLTGVSKHPYYPKSANVRGAATLRHDELHDLQPGFVSLVDRAANRRKWQQRAVARRALVGFTIRCDASVPPAAPTIAAPADPANTPAANTPVDLEATTQRQADAPPLLQRKTMPEPTTTTAAAPRTDVIRGAVPYAATPEGKGTSWDADAATGRARSYAGVESNADLDDAGKQKKYAGFFAHVDADGKNLGDYKLIHHDVEDGHMVLSRPGLLAAGGVVQGARGGVKLPAGDEAPVKNHLEQHYHALGMKAPWEPGDQAPKTDEQKAAAAGKVQPPKPVAGVPGPGGDIGGVKSDGGLPIARAEDAPPPEAVSWLRRAFAPLAALFAPAPPAPGATAPLRPDGTPPPEVRAEAAVAPVDPVQLDAAAAAAAKGQEPRSEHTTRHNVEYALARSVRAMGKAYSYDGPGSAEPGEPMEFDAEWANQEVSEEFEEASDLLDDVIDSVACNLDAFDSPQEVLDHVATQLQAYLTALNEIFSKSKPDSAIQDLMARVSPDGRAARGVLREIARLTATVDREKRIGAKYSAETAERIGKVHEALKTALQHTGDIMSEIDTKRAGIDGADPLKDGSRPGDIAPGATPAASQGTPGVADTGPKAVQPPAGEGPKIPGAPGVGTTTEAGPGKTADAGPGQAESYARQVAEAIRGMGEDFKRALGELTSRIDKLEGGTATPVETRAAPPPPAAPADPVIAAISELRGDVQKTLDGVTARVSAIETRRQAPHSAGDPPAPPRAPTKRASGDNWAGSVIGDAIRSAPRQGSRK